MVFAALIPLLLRRCVLPITCLIFTSISCFGRAAFSTVQSTPYDHQMSRVSPGLNSAKGPSPDSISLLAVSHLMMQLRGMPYQYSSHWQTAAEVDLAQAGDCKGKAMTLYTQMRKNGAKNVRVVIGRHHIYDLGTHAWVEWQTKEGSYVLDPTFNETPAKTAELSPMTYIPLYAYDGEHKYRARNAGSAAPSEKAVSGAYVPPRAGSAVRPAPARIVSGQSVSAATGVPTRPTQHLQRDTQSSWSDARRSAPNAGGVRRPQVLVVTSHSKYVVPVYRGRGLTQKQHARHGRHASSNVARLRQARILVLSQNGRYVIPIQPTRLPPQL